RLHVSLAHARRLLDRTLRRDDRTRPRARTDPLRRRRDRRLSILGAPLALHARRARTRAGGAPEWARADGDPERAADVPGVRARAAFVAAARLGDPWRAVRFLG